jgi:hypothetical protein
LLSAAELVITTSGDAILKQVGRVSMKFTDLRHGAFVCLAGSGAAIVEAIYWQDGKYKARFRCQDNLLVELTAAEEWMMEPLNSDTLAKFQTARR